MGYKVALVNLGKSVDDTTQKKVTSLLGTPSGFFETVVKKYDSDFNKGTAYGSADVYWTDTTPTVANHELIIYFVRNVGDSVVKHMSGVTAPSGKVAGMTAPDVGTPVGSEVFVSEAKDAGDLAAIAFHEAMHNKLRWNDVKLHGKDGGGGLASATVDSTTKLTDTNRDLMAKHLADNVPSGTTV